MIRDLAARGVGFTAIMQPELNTETPTGKMLLAIVGCLAEMENDLRRARTTEGMARAKAEGRRVAPDRKMDRDLALRQLKELQDQGLSANAAGKIVGYSSKHVYRLMPDGWPKFAGRPTKAAHRPEFIA